MDVSYTWSRSGVSLHLTHLLIVSHSVIRQYDHSHRNHSRFITHRRLGVNKPVLRHVLEITGYAYACKQNGIASTRTVETLRRGVPSQHMCIDSGSPCDRPHRNWSARAPGRNCLTQIFRNRSTSGTHLRMATLRPCMAPHRAPANTVIRSRRPSAHTPHARANRQSTTY